MANLKQLFEINDFTLFDEEIEVTVERGQREKTISVPRARFEKWMQNTDRLDYCNDYADCQGEHVQQTGTFSIEGYWSDINIEKKVDLYEFIVLKIMDVRQIFDIETPLKQILANA